MKILLFFLSLTSVCFAAQDPSGFWKGNIILPGAELPINVELINGKDGWSGTIDIPVQGIRGYALSEITVAGEKVAFKLAGIPGEPSFDGKLIEDGKSIKGSFFQGPQELNFSLSRTEKVAEDLSFDMTPIAGKGVVGAWRGLLTSGPMKLRLELLVVDEGEAGLSALLNSIDQNVQIPVDEIKLDGKTFEFEIAAVQGSFVGDLNENGSSAKGIWTQMGQSLALTLHRVK